MHHGKRCAGAVWKDGSSSKQYCGNDPKLVWLANCCKWQAGKCIPKKVSRAVWYRNGIIVIDDALGIVICINRIQLGLFTGQHLSSYFFTEGNIKKDKFRQMKIFPGLNPRIPGIPGLGDGEIEDVVNLPPICKDNVLSKKFNILF